MSTTPFMPFWVSDFLGDTLDLDASEVGAYMLLLMAQWNRGGDSLPDDSKKLQRVARCGRNWPTVWSNISRFFKVDENGIYSKRLRLEAQNVASKREVNARNGALGGKAKSLKTNDVGLANATDPLERNSAIPEPEPEPYKKEDTNVSLPVSPASEVSEAVQVFNEVAGRTQWPTVQKMSPSRTKSLKARLSEVGGIEGWRTAIQKAEKSDFLCGRTSRPWQGFGFDWLLKPANFTKLMEGNYDQSTDNGHSGGGGNGGGGSSSGRRDGTDPALEQIARLAGAG